MLVQIYGFSKEQCFPEAADGESEALSKRLESGSRDLEKRLRILQKRYSLSVHVHLQIHTKASIEIPTAKKRVKLTISIVPVPHAYTNQPRMNRRIR